MWLTQNNNLPLEIGVGSSNCRLTFVNSSDLSIPSIIINVLGELSIWPITWVNWIKQKIQISSYWYNLQVDLSCTWFHHHYLISYVLNIESYVLHIESCSYGSYLSLQNIIFGIMLPKWSAALPIMALPIFFNWSHRKVISFLRP